MKNLLVISLLLLVGCIRFNTSKSSELLKVGDCFEVKMKQDLERWDKDESRISKVLEIGVKKYRTVWTYSRYFDHDEIPFYRGEDTFSYVEDFGKAIQCPVPFSGVY